MLKLPPPKLLPLFAISVPAFITGPVTTPLLVKVAPAWLRRVAAPSAMVPLFSTPDPAKLVSVPTPSVRPASTVTPNSASDMLSSASSPVKSPPETASVPLPMLAKLTPGAVRSPVTRKLPELVMSPPMLPAAQTWRCWSTVSVMVPVVAKVPELVQAEEGGEVRAGAGVGDRPGGTAVQEGARVGDGGHRAEGVHRAAGADRGQPADRARAKDIDRAAADVQRGGDRAVVAEGAGRVGQAADDAIIVAKARVGHRPGDAAGRVAEGARVGHPSRPCRCCPAWRPRRSWCRPQRCWRPTGRCWTCR